MKSKSKIHEPQCHAGTKIVAKHPYFALFQQIQYIQIPLPTMDNPAIFEPNHSLQIASSRHTKRDSIICSSITRVKFLARRVLVHDHSLEMKYTIISVFQRWSAAISHATHPPHVRRRLRKKRIRMSVTSRWRRYEQRYDPFPSTRRPRPCPLGAIGSCAR